MSSGLTEPMKPAAAKALIRAILDSGTVDLGLPHAQQRLSERRMDAVDVENVLRAGDVEPGRKLRGTWRYRVTTNHMVVVVRFRSSKRLVVITAWRKQRR